MDEDYFNFIFEYFKILYYCVGICCMGIDDVVVVDLFLKFNGLDSLCIVDNFIMLMVIFLNINVVVIMIGEKVVDMIKVDYGMEVV